MLFCLSRSRCMFYRLYQDKANFWCNFLASIPSVVSSCFQCRCLNTLCLPSWWNGILFITGFVGISPSVRSIFFLWEANCYHDLIVCPGIPFFLFYGTVLVNVSQNLILTTLVFRLIWNFPTDQVCCGWHNVIFWFN